MRPGGIASVLRAATVLTALLPAVLLAGGCRAGTMVPPASQAPVPALRQVIALPVPPPPPLRSADPQLLVALAARLGPVAGTLAERAAPLELRAARGRLTLSDAVGRTVTAPRFSLRWRLRPRPEPLLIRRRALGPFASYESAEQAALTWRQQGVNAVIARPLDWEVWAPPDAVDPPGASARLLERRETQRLILELAGPGAPLSLEGPIRIEAPGGLLWAGATYRGPFLLQSDAHGTWSLVERVPLERYLEGVVPHEIGAGAPAAALAAQAILARTWALRNRQRFAADGYNLCADTQCQVYGAASAAGPAVRQAIAASHLQVLASGGEPIHAVYHASNGGVAAGFDEVWSGSPLPYLKPFVDGPPAFVARYALPLQPGPLAALLRRGSPPAWGADHPRYRWQRILTAAQLREALPPPAVGLPSGLQVLERGPSGRVLALEISGPAGRVVLRLDAIRRRLRQLPSTLFLVTPAGSGRWLVEGGGFGHGAGLSQAGAIALARSGWSTARILQHYYPGTALVPLRSLGEAL